MKKAWFTVLGLALLLPLGVQAQKTVFVAEVKPTASLRSAAAADGSANLLNRFAEGMDGHLLGALAASGRFKPVERTVALEKMVQEQNLYDAGEVAERGAEAGKLTGAELLLFVGIDEFRRMTDAAVFEGVKRMRNVYSVSAVMRIVDASTGDILGVSDVQLKKSAFRDADSSSEANVTARFEADLPALARDLAQRSVRMLTAAVFPAAVMDVDGTTVTLNRGSDTFAVGDVCKIYGKSRMVTDPDTGKSVRIKGRFCGRLTITDVEPNYAQGELQEGAKATVGARVSPAPTKE